MSYIDDKTRAHLQSLIPAMDLMLFESLRKWLDSIGYLKPVTPLAESELSARAKRELKRREVDFLEEVAMFDADYFVSPQRKTQPRWAFEIIEALRRRGLTMGQGS